MGAAGEGLEAEGGFWAVPGTVQHWWAQVAGFLAGEQKETLPWRGEPGRASSKRMVQPPRGSHPRLRWALWGTGMKCVFLGSGPLRPPPVTVGAGGTRPGGASLGAPAGSGSPKARGQYSGRLTAKVALAFLLAAVNEGVEGLEAEGQG